MAIVGATRFAVEYLAELQVNLTGADRLPVGGHPVECLQYVLCCETLAAGDIKYVVAALNLHGQALFNLFEVLVERAADQRETL